MRYVLFAIFLASNWLLADGPRIKSVWKEAAQTAGKQYLLVLSGQEDPYTSDGDDSIIIFGEKNGRFHARSFAILSNFYETLKKKYEGRDDFYFLTLNVVAKNQPITAHLRGAWGGINHPLTYSKVDQPDPNLSALAEKAAQLIADRLEQVETQEARNIGDFKEKLDLVIRQMGAIGTGDADAVPVFDLQIEQTWERTSPSGNLATATISPSANDPISQALRVSRWYRESEVLSGEENADAKSFPTHSTRVKAFKTDLLKKAARKYVRYEITIHSTFPCEDFFVDYADYAWVLTDGSIYRYSPLLECD